MPSLQGFELHRVTPQGVARPAGIVAHLLALVVLGLFSLATVAAAAPAPIAKVSVNTQQLGARIPPDFLGFSNEVSDSNKSVSTPTSKARGTIHRPAGVPENAQLAYVLGQPDAPNSGFFMMMRNLGPGLLRLGGNSQDNTCWDPEASPHPDWCHDPLTPEQLKLYSTAVGAAGWRMIVGLNLRQNSPQWALSEVTQGVAKQIPAQQIMGMEICNEPDLFARTPSRSKDYSPSDNVRDTSACIRALRNDSLASKYALVGPAVCCNWLSNPQGLATILEGIGSDLSMVSVHHYATSTCRLKNVTVADLLSPQRMQEFNELSAKAIALARQHHLPIALLETNSTSCEGMAGVSDAFASSVWSLNYMFNVAREGYAHIGFHFSYRTGGSAYNAVQTFSWDTDNQQHYLNVAQPLYYGMYMFAKHASGEHFLPASIATEANITSFATTACATCAVHVFVINQDEHAGGVVDVHVPGQLGAASMLLLSAPNLHSLAAEVRYGGQQFDSNGHIDAAATTIITPSSGGDYRFELPNASAAVLTFQR